MIFPTQEAEIDKLANMMIYGFWHHSADFPNVDRINFLLAVRVYEAAKEAMADAVSLSKIASKEKQEKLDILKNVMRDCLKKSEVDVSSEPQKLKLIGWGPRANLHQLKTPNQPINLKAVEKENGAIQLNWKKGSGRQQVFNFIIESRRQSNGNSIDWQLIASSYDTEILLNDQPQRTNLEYRVRAVNTSGKSLPSNTASITI